MPPLGSPSWYGPPSTELPSTRPTIAHSPLHTASPILDMIRRLSMQPLYWSHGIVAVSIVVLPLESVVLGSPDSRTTPTCWAAFAVAHWAAKASTALPAASNSSFRLIFVSPRFGC